jgi:hypothetical protein
VNWRILNDRREILAFTCDKLRVKDEATRLGISTPRTLWSGADIRSVRGLDLPDRWVLKPNHSSGLIEFGRGPLTCDHAAALACLTRGWTEDALGPRYGEWAYTQARPLLLIEEMLGDGRSPLLDFRFYTFGEQISCIQVDDSHVGHNRRFYTPAWEPLGVRQRAALARPSGPPAGLERMSAWAVELGRRFDFMRVDFYAIDGEVYLGELTPYPTGGLVPFSPTSFDEELGEAWTLPELG